MSYALGRYWGQMDGGAVMRGKSAVPAYVRYDIFVNNVTPNTSAVSAID